MSDDVHAISKSAIDTYRECPKKHFAKHVTRQHKPTDTEAKVVGTLFHAMTLTPERTPGLIRKHEEMVRNKDGSLSKKFSDNLDRMADAIHRHPFVEQYLLGDRENEVELYADIEGFRFKGFLDVVNVQRRFFSDLKTAASFEDVWITDELAGKSVKRPWWFGYLTQMVLYSRLMMENFQLGKIPTPFIIGVTKEKIPDVQLLGFHKDIKPEMSLAYRNMMATARLIMLDIEAGEGADATCGGSCEWCRKSKLITEVTWVAA